jgi:hypothetical protein
MTERRPSRPKVRRPGRPPPPDDAGPSRRVPQPSPSRLRAPARGRRRRSSTSAGGWRADMSGSSGQGNGIRSMITSWQVSPGTSRPCQRLSVPKRLVCASPTNWRASSGSSVGQNWGLSQAPAWISKDSPCGQGCATGCCRGRGPSACRGWPGRRSSSRRTRLSIQRPGRWHAEGQGFESPYDLVRDNDRGTVAA